MEWVDEGIVLSVRRHGETAAIASLLTSAHGRHGGLVRGGAGSRARGLYQPGNRLRAIWRARLSEHLGHYSGGELLRAHAADILDAPLPLLALGAATAMVDAALPEREPHPALFDSLAALVGRLGSDGWEVDYVRWELGFLAELGFGLDLRCCAATGRNDGLVWVSPRSGRAVSAAAGEPYRDRLLPLPAFLLGRPDGSVAAAAGAGELADGLRLTGYFLDRHVFEADRKLPAARARLHTAIAAGGASGAKRVGACGDSPADLV